MTRSASAIDEHSQPPIGARQTQFLNVISRDEAERKFHEHLVLGPLGGEPLPLSEAAGRVLAEDVVAEVDVPSFDRSNVDGFAVHSADTAAASEDAPRTLRLNAEVLSPGVRPSAVVEAGTATTIATGGMLPRGADAVLMLEHSDVLTGGDLEVRRAVGPGENVTFAGTDIAQGETVLRAGQRLTSRELGVLAAIGRSTVNVIRRPTVAILSTGDEIVPPGRPLPVGSVYDSNAAILAAAVAECGGIPACLGVVPDEESQLESALQEGLQHDVVLLSGGTSKGAGDLSYRIVSRLGRPGIVAHGVALKPGKPICLAVCAGKPVVILPGFPTSAIFTFHEFVAPVIRAFAGQPPDARQTRTATLPMRVNSQRGRTEYLLVSLFENSAGELVAYPMGQGSGSVTTFSRADGFITIGQHSELVEAGTEVSVTLLDRHLAPADLTVITSHCTGLDRLLSLVGRRGITLKVMVIGSTGALAAARRGECDLAGIHLLDPESGEYNRPFLSDELELLPGYGRMQCFVFRDGDTRFATQSPEDAIRAALSDADCRMVNRNAGSGTRILLDRLLAAGHAARPAGHHQNVHGAASPCLEASGFKAVALPRGGRGADSDSEASAKNRGEEASEGSEPAGTWPKPPGYGVQVRSHNAVCAAIAHGRADWGVAIDTVAALYGLRTIPVTEEQFDFVVPRSRLARPAVQAFIETLSDPTVRAELQATGFHLNLS